ncbi:hypothetical protein Athai_31450 [Actinocatenispora thailandica]|uniref:ADP ribosyltransferase domain-containing protein n=1 Tax=Actinocatenispora thailandica TaxID=227318 RepID=A0A7R7DQF6_9ACTN|nr:hypothetical protein [Actinocatenispora thailandica]BCJ35642.1 hypothetical protein Athai_31450 [Actinocatenispora thailandica]
MPSIRGLLRNGEYEPGEPIVEHSVGHAHVLSRSEPSSALQALALPLAADPDNDIVLLDLQDELPVVAWESVASAVPRSRRRGIRLLAHGGQRGASIMIGQWLAQRLNRTVLAPNGDLVRGPGGVLFVYSKPDSGWMRLRPGRVPVWDSKRYPTPRWDSAASEYWTSSSTTGIEPMPSGVWIHDVRAPEVIAAHRGLLSANVPCQPEVLTVLLGCPGTAPVSLDDAARFWHGLDESVRARVRFVRYGDVRVPGGEAFGQALADFLGTGIVCYTGMPIGRPAVFEIRTIASNARPGWRPFVLELGYQPRNGSPAAGLGPALLSHRIPLPRAEEVSPRIYWYAPDAVIEIVQSGLWVRPPAEPTNAAQVRSVPLDPDVAALIFDDAVPARAQRMRVLAEDLAGQLDRSVGAASVLCAASALATRRELPPSVAAALATLAPAPAVARLEAADQAPATLGPRAPAAPADGTLSPRGADDAPAGRDTPAGPAQVAPAAPEQPHPAVLSDAALGWAPPEWLPAGQPDGSAPEDDNREPGDAGHAGGAAAAPAAGGPGAPDPAVTEPTGSRDDPPPDAGRPAEADAAGSTTAHPAREQNPMPSLGRPPSPSLPPDAPFPPPAGDGAPDTGAAPPGDGAHLRAGTEPTAPGAASTEDGTAPTPPGAQQIRPDDPPAVLGDVAAGGPAATVPTGTVARPQPVPAAKASALIPRRGLDNERSWLRRSLSRDFDTLASSVARIMSEHPGMTGGAGTNNDDVLVDSVAVRLYLSSRGIGIDAGLRSGRGGPHVPFARCTAAGLSRLPSFRGTAVLRADLTDSEWAFYRDRRLVTDWSFVNMLSAPCANQRGDTDVLVWSMTARRTALLEPDGDEHVDDRVVFLPGTNFKVLAVEAGTPERRGAVLLREIGSSEIDEEGNVDRNRLSLDELAIKSLRRSVERWTDGERRQRTGTATAARFGVLPGLAGPVREMEVALP